ncbi:MAG: hypothetical protein AB7F22_15080 [Reyranella sp.]|uniref:hypothetical protein n=1 Tax=Reyranella sp. TaxID=1929291 RepID=UPI003D098625
MRCAEVNPLLFELIAAFRNARREDLAQILDARGIRQADRPLLVEEVAVDDHYYAPEPEGRLAFVTPYFERGQLVDLIATGIESRTSRTRMGNCTVLGEEHIHDARESEGPLRLYNDPLEWLRHGRAGACIIDWRAARFDLADLRDIACSNDMLAARVEKALLRPVTLPRLYVPEVAHAA